MDCEDNSTVAISTASSTNSLCNVCQEIDIKDFLFNTDNEPSPIDLGPLIAIIGKSSCPLCSLVTEALKRSWTALPLHYQASLYTGFNKTDVYLIPGKGTTGPYPRTIWIQVCHRGRTIDRGISADAQAELKYLAELRLLADDAVLVGHSGTGHGREIVTTCSSDLMQKWYGLCKETHEYQNCGVARIVSDAAFDTPREEKIPDASLPIGTRFIDVEEMCLVSVLETPEFVALSYVWGTLVDDQLMTKKYNVLDREQRDGLREVVLSKTIADAILVTKSMGIKHVWVDSLCIVQDGEKQEQIQNMDRIYGLASLVIVAATGIDATAGLTGCSGTPRSSSTQITATIQGLNLAISAPPLRYILENAKWNTRGWTFQEWHLARRALVFTDEQVYFICSSSSFSEDIALEETEPHSAMFLIMENFNASTIRHYLPSRYSKLTVNSGWIDYIQTVEAYSQRELTFESDFLLAISGLLSNLHRASRNRFLSGLSIGLFHDALFWVPINGIGHRWILDEDQGLLFPTWSWAGWEGAVKYRVFPASKTSLVTKWQVIKDNAIHTLGTPLSSPQNDRLIVGLTSFSDRLTSSDMEEEIKCTGEGGLGPNEIGPGVLHFQTELATLQLAGGVINDMNSRAEALLDQRGAYMGVALLDKQRSVVEKVTGGFRDVKCVAVSISDAKMPYMDKPAFSTLPEDEEWVNVLVVLETQAGMYIRSGVGQVCKSAWNEWVNAEVVDVLLA